MTILADWLNFLETVKSFLYRPMEWISTQLGIISVNYFSMSPHLTPRELLIGL